MQKEEELKISDKCRDSALDKMKGVKTFDYKDVRCLHKLGTGGFGTVRLAKLKINQKEDPLLLSKNFQDEISTQEESDSSHDSPRLEKQETAEELKVSKFQTRKIVGQTKSSNETDDQWKLVAIKVISKYKVLTTCQQQHMYNEIKYMSQLNSPFIVQMHGVQQDAQNIYIMMDYIQNGELMKLLSDMQRFDSNLSRFFAAQIVLAFEYLHKKDLIYRDLKPENILLLNNGYIKLTDFGFIKRLKPWERTYTLCGTPEYMAPEVIMNTGHGAAADWYTMGIFIYEMTVGRPPFMHSDTYEIFKMILRQKISFPKGFPSDAKSLVKHLTAHDLSKRFGNLINGIEDVKTHRYFKTIDFKQLEKKQIPAPHMPI